MYLTDLPDLHIITFRIRTYLAVQNSLIGDLVSDLTDSVTHSQYFYFDAQRATLESQRLVTFETFDQSDDMT